MNSSAKTLFRDQSLCFAVVGTCSFCSGNHNFVARESISNVAYDVFIINTDGKCSNAKLKSQWHKKRGQLRSCFQGMFVVRPPFSFVSPFYYFDVIKQTQVGGYSYSVSIHLLFNFVSRYIEREIETWSNMTSRDDILSHSVFSSVPVHMQTIYNLTVESLGEGTVFLYH